MLPVFQNHADCPCEPILSCPDTFEGLISYYKTANYQRWIKSGDDAYANYHIRKKMVITYLISRKSPPKIIST
jgi:hypothetical protein